MTLIEFADSLEQFYGKVFSQRLTPRRQINSQGATSRRSIIRSSTVICSYCGASGQAHAPWTSYHGHHVRCKCLKVVTRKGLASHLAYMKRMGRPCR